MLKHISYLLFSIILGLSFTHLPSALDEHSPIATKALLDVRDQFINGLSQLEATVDQYYTAARDTETTSVELQKLHIQTRLAYKKVEFLLEYFDREAVKKYLNGAPLLTLEPKVPEIRVVQPRGLQILDERVFANDLHTERAAIQHLTEKLKLDLSRVTKYVQGIRMEHRHVFEAVRLELIRIFTLGVTGFDTPGSVNALPEAVVALQSMHQTLRAYQPLLGESNAALWLRLDRVMGEAQQYLIEHDDFDTFNRLQFLRECINPLYALTYQLHRTLGIETINEVSDLPQPVNYEADNIFAENFLNTNYYANPGDGQQQEARRELGRLLFFDPILSANNQRACASCHRPELGFTDGLPKSQSLNGHGTISRNAPALVNSVYSERYFYDLREYDLSRQIKHVVLDSLEFGTDFFTIVEKLEKSPEYRAIFAAAYPGKGRYQLSKWSVSDALAAYIAGLTSFNSDFDQYVRGEIEQIDPAVERGFNLFMGKAACGTCHFAPVFNGTVPPYYRESESEILGVPVTSDTLNPVLDPDPGRAGNSRPEDESSIFLHSFKTVTVRNAALTAPYMHNGVYATLEDVIDFYNRGGGAGMGLDVYNQTLPDAPLNLTEKEKSDLVAFMEALTDHTYAGDAPDRLPDFDVSAWNTRKIGGNY